MTKERLAELAAAGPSGNDLKGSNRTRLIVDFCVEDVQKTQVLAQRQDRLKQVSKITV